MRLYSGNLVCVHAQPLSVCVYAGPPEAFFTPALIGAVSTAGVLFLLLLVAMYKWKQVYVIHILLTFYSTHMQKVSDQLIFLVLVCKSKSKV